MLEAIATRSESQAEAIRKAVFKSVKSRDAYSEEVAAQLFEVLGNVEEKVAAAILQYNLGPLPDNKLPAIKGLKELQADILEVIKRLRDEGTLAFKKATPEAYRQGIQSGIEEMVAVGAPDFEALTSKKVKRLTTRMFNVIDKDALDFMANYNVVLAGDVSDEVANGIKRVVMNGVATGKGTDDIVRDLGHVVKDKRQFRHSGKKVFSKAQHRMALIARTEILRAHNQGRVKFYSEVGVEKIEWMTMDDERMCPVCEPLDGEFFSTKILPSIPNHPNCRCTILPVLS